MASWRNGKLTKWQVDEMASWRNGKLTKWQVDKMAIKRSRLAPKNRQFAGSGVTPWISGWGFRVRTHPGILTKMKNWIKLKNRKIPENFCRKRREKNFVTFFEIWTIFFFFDISGIFFFFLTGKKMLIFNIFCSILWEIRRNFFGLVQCRNLRQKSWRRAVLLTWRFDDSPFWQLTRYLVLGRRNELLWVTRVYTR